MTSSAITVPHDIVTFTAAVNKETRNAQQQHQSSRQQQQLDRDRFISRAIYCTQY